MSYTATVWKNRVVEKPRTFTFQDNGDGTYTLLSAEGTIYEAGTPVNAANLNKMEAGIAAALPMDGSGAMTGPIKLLDADGYLSRSGGRVSLGSALGDTIIDAKGASYLGSNAYWNGTAWNRRDITKAAYLLEVFNDVSGGIAFYNATAGANPITWSHNKVWYSGNDGSGSGLDADLFDGINSDRFIYGTNNLGATVWNTEADSITKSGFYWIEGNYTNLPIADNGYLTHHAYYASSDFAMQNLVIYTTNRMFMRRKLSGSWQSWVEVWNSGTIPQTRDNSGVLELYTGGAWKPVGGVKSIQRGTVSAAASATTNVTITAVDLNKTFVNFPNFSGQAGLVYAALTSTTNLAIVSGLANTLNMSYEVVESY